MNIPVWLLCFECGRRLGRGDTPSKSTMNRAKSEPQHCLSCASKRREQMAASRPAPTHCARGHSLDGDNVREWRGKMICKACDKMRNEKYRSRPEVAARRASAERARKAAMKLREGNST